MHTPSDTSLLCLSPRRNISLLYIGPFVIAFANCCVLEARITYSKKINNIRSDMYMLLMPMTVELEADCQTPLVSCFHPHHMDWASLFETRVAWLQV